MPITRYTGGGLKKLVKSDLRLHIVELYGFIDLFDGNTKTIEENEKLKKENEKLKKENMSIQYEYFDKTGENYDPKFDGIWSKSENSDEIIEALGNSVDLEEENKKLKEEIASMNVIKWAKQLRDVKEENEKLIKKIECVSESLDQMETYIDGFGETSIKDIDWEDMNEDCLGCRLSRDVGILDLIIGQLIENNKELKKEKEKVVIAEAC